MRSRGGQSHPTAKATENDISHNTDLHQVVRHASATKRSRNALPASIRVRGLLLCFVVVTASIGLNIDKMSKVGIMNGDLANLDASFEPGAVNVLGTTSASGPQHARQVHKPSFSGNSIGGNLEADVQEPEKPVLILHVGPPKTGSTTLQCTLESFRRELGEDGIVYIGRPECKGMNIERKFRQEFRLFETALVTGYACQKQLLDIEENLKQKDMDTFKSSGAKANGEVQAFPSCWDDFIQRLAEYKQDGKHVIFSDEAMSNRVSQTWQYQPSLAYPWVVLKSALNGMGWDVQILIVHRPLFDYLPSVYVEQYKDGPGKRRLRQWYGGGSSCPLQGGRAVPRPFDTSPHTQEITIANLLKKGQKLYPTPAKVYELFQDHEFNTYLVDMLGKVNSANGKNMDFVQHIICDIIPNTVKTCQAALMQDGSTVKKNGTAEKNTKHLNPSLSLHYDFIAIQACQRGLFNGTVVARDVARQAIQHRQEHDLGLLPNDFPLSCPGDEVLREILNESLHHERRLHPNDDIISDQSGRNSNSVELVVPEASHQDRFWSAAREKKIFCTVDSRQVIEDDEWLAFFATMGKQELIK